MLESRLPLSDHIKLISRHDRVLLVDRNRVTIRSCLCKILRYLSAYLRHFITSVMIPRKVYIVRHSLLLLLVHRPLVQTKASQLQLCFRPTTQRSKTRRDVPPSIHNRISSRGCSSPSTITTQATLHACHHFYSSRCSAMTERCFEPFHAAALLCSLQDVDDKTQWRECLPPRQRHCLQISQRQIDAISVSNFGAQNAWSPARMDVHIYPPRECSFTSHTLVVCACYISNTPTLFIMSFSGDLEARIHLYMLCRLLRPCED